MHLSSYQRAWIRAVRRGVAYEDLPSPDAHTIVYAGKHEVVLGEN